MLDAWRDVWHQIHLEQSLARPSAHWTQCVPIIQQPTNSDIAEKSRYAPYVVAITNQDSRSSTFAHSEHVRRTSLLHIFLTLSFPPIFTSQVPGSVSKWYRAFISSPHRLRPRCRSISHLPWNSSYCLDTWRESLKFPDRPHNISYCRRVNNYRVQTTFSTQRWKWVIFLDPWPTWPMAITSFHPTHGNRRGVTWWHDNLWVLRAKNRTLKLSFQLW